MATLMRLDTYLGAEMTVGFSAGGARISLFSPSEDASKPIITVDGVEKTIARRIDEEYYADQNRFCPVGMGWCALHFALEDFGIVQSSNKDEIREMINYSYLDDQKRPDANIVLQEPTYDAKTLSFVCVTLRSYDPWYVMKKKYSFQIWRVTFEFAE